MVTEQPLDRDSDLEPQAECFECGEVTTWEPTAQQGYDGFACRGCGTFQEGGFFDDEGRWWEMKGDTLRVRESTEGGS